MFKRRGRLAGDETPVQPPQPATVVEELPDPFADVEPDADAYDPAGELDLVATWEFVPEGSFWVIAIHLWHASGISVDIEDVYGDELPGLLDQLQAVTGIKTLGIRNDRQGRRQITFRVWDGTSLSSRNKVMNNLVAVLTRVERRSNIYALQIEEPPHT